MDYIELDLDSTVATQSAFKDNSSLDTPVFELGRDLQNVVGFKIIETNIPSSYYLVNNEFNSEYNYTRNRIYLTIVSTVYPATLYVYYIEITPNRAYTAAELASEITTKFNAALTPNAYGVLTANVTYDSGSGKFKIIFTNSLLLGVNHDVTITMDPTIAVLLGLLPVNTTVTDKFQQSLVSKQVWNFSPQNVALATGPNYLQINSLKLCNIVKNYVPEGPLGTVGQTNTAICQVPITTNFGGVNYWQNTQQDSFDTQNLFVLDRFDLFLTLGTSKVPLKLNGLSWQCKIRLFIDRNYTANSLQGNIEQNRIIKRIRPT